MSSELLPGGGKGAGHPRPPVTFRCQNRRPRVSVPPGPLGNLTGFTLRRKGELIEVLRRRRCRVVAQKIEGEHRDRGTPERRGFANRRLAQRSHDEFRAFFRHSGYESRDIGIVGIAHHDRGAGVGIAVSVPRREKPVANGAGGLREGAVRGQQQGYFGGGLRDHEALGQQLRHQLGPGGVTGKAISPRFDFPQEVRMVKQEASVEDCEFDPSAEAAWRRKAGGVQFSAGESAERLPDEAAVLACGHHAEVELLERAALARRVEMATGGGKGLGPSPPDSPRHGRRRRVHDRVGEECERPIRISLREHEFGAERRTLHLLGRRRFVPASFFQNCKGFDMTIAGHERLSGVQGEVPDGSSLGESRQPPVLRRRIREALLRQQSPCGDVGIVVRARRRLDACAEGSRDDQPGGEAEDGDGKLPIRLLHCAFSRRS